MLAAAAPAADTGFAAHDLRDQAEKVARISQEMTVVAMIGQHRVLGVVQCANNRQSSDLLAEAGMRGARNQAARELIEDELFSQTNQMAVGIDALRIETDTRSALVVAREPGYGQRAGIGRRVDAWLNGLGNRHVGDGGRTQNRHPSRKRLIILGAALQKRPCHDAPMSLTKAMSLPALEPIRDEDVPGFCRFLCENLSRDRSAEEWAQAFSQDWCQSKPNNGFLIRDDGRIVGGIGAIYAERTVRNRTERFCNITSWCVQDAFRAHSMRLAMAVVGQPEFHFTDLTPTEVVSKTLQFLKFMPMNERHALLPNVPWPFARLAGTRVVSDPGEIGTLLAPEDAKAYRDHLHLPWLRHLAVGRAGAWCYVVWKRTRLKGITGAMIIALSDPELFLRCRLALGSHLLVHHGLSYTRVESRLLPRLPTLCIELSGYRNKVFKSDTLTAADMSNLYSELVALDL